MFASDFSGVLSIKENKRNRKQTKNGRKRLFDQKTYNLRYCVELTFAWEDKFKRLLIRFETIQLRHQAFKFIAYALINLRSFIAALNSKISPYVKFII